MRAGVFALLVVGCGSTEAPSAAAFEPLRPPTREAIRRAEPNASASAVAAIEAPCEPCRATDPLCTCFNGGMKVGSLPPNPSASAQAGAYGQAARG